MRFKPDAHQQDLHSYGLHWQSHFEQVTEQLMGFVSGTNGEADGLIHQIVLICDQVNDHWVMANVKQPQGTEIRVPEASPHLDRQKVSVLPTVGYLHVRYLHRLNTYL